MTLYIAISLALGQTVEGKGAAKQEADDEFPVTPQAFMEFTQSSFTDIHQQLRSYMEAFDSFQVAEKRRMEIATMDDVVGFEVGVDAEQQVVHYGLGEGPIIKLILEQLDVVTDEIEAVRRRLPGDAGGYTFDANKKTGKFESFRKRHFTVNIEGFTWQSKELGKSRQRKLYFASESGGRHCGFLHEDDVLTLRGLFEDAGKGLGQGKQRDVKTLRLKNIANIKLASNGEKLQESERFFKFIANLCEARPGVAPS